MKVVFRLFMTFFMPLVTIPPMAKRFVLSYTHTTKLNKFKRKENKAYEKNT